MIAEILGTLGIIEKAGKFVNWARKWRNSSSSSEFLTSRFIRLFESHQVHRNQIPRFFEHGLALEDVQNDETLLPKLKEPLLDDACRLFSVRREWLDGAEPLVYERHDFYKHPRMVAPFLEALKKPNTHNRLDCILIAPEERRGPALLVFSEVIGNIGDKPIYRYHLCNNWVFDYWKSRAYLAACVAITWKHGIHVRGIYAPLKQIREIESGEVLFGSIAVKKKGLWYPEDMALKPSVFLHGLNAERNNYGLAAALQLWLRLEEEGYLRTGLPMYNRENIREAFQRELTRINL